MPAIPLPNGRQQFLDLTGAPIVGGKVYHYRPGGLTAKDTYQNYQATILNPNPITLDELGTAVIWGIGRYRQILTDADDVQVWDEETVGFLSELMAADPILTFLGNPDQPSHFLGGEYVTRGIDFPPDFEGSGGITPEVVPTSSFPVTIKVDGVTIGTATCSTIGAWSFVTASNTAKSAPAGSQIKYYGPVTPDATMADFGFTLMGSYSE